MYTWVKMVIRITEITLEISLIRAASIGKVSLKKIGCSLIKTHDANVHAIVYKQMEFY